MPAADPQTEARRCFGQCEITARDERACSVAERARSRGGQGRAAAREAGAESALVTAVCDCTCSVRNRKYSINRIGAEPSFEARSDPSVSHLAKCYLSVPTGVYVHVNAT